MLNNFDKSKLEEIRNLFLNELGKENATGLCHVISICTMKYLNKSIKETDKWILCEGYYVEDSQEITHYWLENSNVNNKSISFIDMTADQFGYDAPLLQNYRPDTYKLTDNNQESLVGLIEAGAVQSWMAKLNTI